uniref:SUMO specific peptidase 7 n=1 Tax=Chelonoidis abingdonii TaxID=106734 RepID=A0A8C0GCF7_CHEAB
MQNPGRDTVTQDNQSRLSICTKSSFASRQQPTVMLTNVLRTEIGRKYTQSQLITDANLSDVDKLQSDRPPSSSVASLEILQILNPPLQNLFISKRQPKVILKNVLRMKIGRKYIKRQLITDANLSDADKLLSGQPPSSSVGTHSQASSFPDIKSLGQRHLSLSLSPLPPPPPGCTVPCLHCEFPSKSD